MADSEIYYRNVPKSWSIEEEYKDIESINFWKKSKALYGDDLNRLAQERKVLETKARDHCRTPVQWTAEPNGGFCKQSVRPWMRVNDDYRECNTENQMNAASEDDLSVWQFWQRGLANRKEHKDVFIYGDYETLGEPDEHIFAYLRTGKKTGKWIVVLNWSGEDAQWIIPATVNVKGWMAGNYLKGKPDKAMEGKLKLKPWEGVLGQC